MNFDLDYLEAMQTGNTDRLVLKMAIQSHRTFMCPYTKKGLDVDRSFMVEMSSPQAEKNFGPYDLSIIGDQSFDDWLAQWLKNNGLTSTIEECRANGVTFRQVKG